MIDRREKQKRNCTHFSICRDLIAFSGIGLLPALSMMFSDAPISGVGILVKIKNKWTQIPELYIAEYYRNAEGFPDAINGATNAGLRVFRFVERLHQVNASSIFWCPLKTVCVFLLFYFFFFYLFVVFFLSLQSLSPESEEKFIQFVQMKHSTPNSSVAAHLESPIIHWAKEEFGDSIIDREKSQFMDILGPCFVREALWYVLVPTF